MTPSSPFRHARLLTVSTLLSSFLFALLLKPINRLWEQFNAHVLHIPWKIYLPFCWTLTFTCLTISLIGSVILIVKTRGRTPSKLRDAAYGSILIFVTGLMLGVFSVGSGHDPRLRQRYDTLAHLRNVQWIIDDYKTTHAGQWPADYFALLSNGIIDHDLKYFSNKTPDIKSKNPSLPEIEAYSDFVYFGGDLIDSPLLKKEASQILVFIGKSDFPEIPYVINHVDIDEYEYPYAARPAAFADGQVRCILPQDLQSNLAAHNAARARLGLPPQRFNP